MEKSEKPTVLVLEKALKILESLNLSERPLGVNEIAKINSIGVSTAYRILQTLNTNGWVFKDKFDKYLLGHKLMPITANDSFHLALKEVSYYVMAKLTKTESQAMNLLVRHYETCIILQQSRTRRIIDYVPPVGAFLPIYASAGGKILLSEIPPAQLNEVLDLIELTPITTSTITRRSDLLNELQKIKERGCAFDIHESIESGCCVSVPVRNIKGEIIAALSFSGFIGNKTESDLQYYVPLLKKASIQVMERLYGITSHEDPSGYR